MIEYIPDDQWEVIFTISESTLSLYEYFQSLAEHDLHHFNHIKRSNLI